jgi:hypothetical protein
MDSLEGSVSDRFRVPIATAAILAKDDGLDTFRLVHFRSGSVRRPLKSYQLFWRQRNLKGGILIFRRRTKAKVLWAGIVFLLGEKFFSELFAMRT